MDRRLDADTARAMLGIEPGAPLTRALVETSYTGALLEHLVQEARRSDHATQDVGRRRQELEHARVVLLKRSERLPPRGEALVPLFLVQFFVGGFVLFAVAIGTMVGWATWYDGALSIIGWGFFAVMTALISMAVAVVVGLPLRLVPSLRTRWLANGEFTILGAVLGLVALQVVVATAPVRTVVDELGPYESLDVNGWALLLAWSLFTFSIAHFVWPLRWTRREPHAEQRGPDSSQQV